MRAVENSECRRLESMRRTVGSLRDNDHLGEYNRLRALAKQLQDASKNLEGDEKKLNDAGAKRVEKEARAVKSLLLPSLRSETDSHHVGYVDACYVLAADEAAAPLLGSGGNDGSRDFGVNFAEMLQELIDFGDGGPTVRAGAELESALLDVVRRAEAHGSMGQFSPGQGGPNATTGYEGYNPLNAWDVVLAMEGTLAFAGALTRRWGATGGGRAAFPFTLRTHRRGNGQSVVGGPEQASRGSLDAPLVQAGHVFRNGGRLGGRAAHSRGTRGSNGAGRGALGGPHRRGPGNRWFRTVFHRPARQQDAVPGDSTRPIQHAGSTAQGPRRRPGGR